MATTKRADFEAVWPSLVEDLKAAATKYNIPENALQWFEKVTLSAFPSHYWMRAC